VKYPKEKFKNIKGVMKRKIYNLTDSNSSNSSGEGEMTVEQERRVKWFTLRWFFQKVGQL
jgi:hypothetical protein